MNGQKIITQELDQAAKVLHDFTRHEPSLASMEEASKQMAQAILSGRKIISCGNGGSHCDAMHFAEELTGKYREDRRALPAICISDPSHISCVGNDYGYEFIFSRYLEALGNEGDVLLAISTSGNSPNIIRAAQTAKKKKMIVVAMSGMTGGELKAWADISMLVPHQGFADRIQEVHIKIIHILILLIEKMTV